VSPCATANPPLEVGSRVADNGRMLGACRVKCLGAIGALLAIGIVGCAGERRPPLAPATPAPATSQPAAEATPAARTTLRGVARDAKGGAVVVTDRGPVYIAGLDAWPAALAGRTVEVTGVLRQMKHIPDPVGPGNTVAQGAWGEQTVIVEATWRVVE
jgi:hypothetical protein